MRINTLDGRRASAFVLLVAFTLSFSSLAGCGGHEHDGHDDHHVHRGSTATGDDGKIQLTLRTEPSPVTTGTNVFFVTVKDADGAPLTEARVGVDVFMPAHGHGSSGDPETTEIGEGEYRIDDVIFQMPGDWRVTFHVEKGHLHDHATFGFDVE